MGKQKENSENAGPKSPLNKDGLNTSWKPRAWVYFIWVAIGFRVYFKIGYSKNPTMRYSQIVIGIPEEPFQCHYLACLNVAQARLFEGMLHEKLQEYQARGEWYTHPNVKHIRNYLTSLLDTIFSLFHCFGYEVYFSEENLGGYRPVLYQNGFVSHLVDPTTGQIIDKE